MKRGNITGTEATIPNSSATTTKVTGSFGFTSNKSLSSTIKNAASGPVAARFRMCILKQFGNSDGILRVM
jgi:hypothetical protein